MREKDRTEATVAKDKGGEAARNGSVDVTVEERVPGVPEAWVGQGAKLRHPVDLNSSFAVGSSAGLLEEVGERSWPC